MKVLLFKKGIRVFATGILMAVAIGGVLTNTRKSMGVEKSGQAALSPTLVRGDVIPGRFIIRLKSGVSTSQFLASTFTSISSAVLNKTESDSPTSEFFIYDSVLNGFAGDLSSLQVETLRRDQRVAAVYPDHVFTLDNVTTEDDLKSEDSGVWGITRIDQHQGPNDEVYQYRYTGKGVNVYVLDTGIRLDHDEYGGRASIGFKAEGVKFGSGVDVGDCHGHGSHTSATIGGRTYGVAKDVNLIGVRTFGCRGQTNESAILKGFDWIATHLQKPAVINLSIGGPLSEPVDAAVAKILEAGGVVVASAGNSEEDACQQSPAHIPGVITVGATDSKDQRAAFSNFGKCVDVFAPGVDILSAGIKNSSDSSIKSGTSMSAPHVTGVVALMLEHYPNATAAEIEKMIIQYSTPEVVSDSLSPTSNLVYSLEDK